MVKEYYKILGVSEDANPKKIRQAYINLAKTTHPDKGGDAEEFKKVNKAYEVLIDETKKREYDSGNENVSIVKYGYDYGEKIEEGELAVSKYADVNNVDAMNEAWLKLCGFYVLSSKEREENPVSDYHLIRAKNMLKVLDSYYKPKYLAANGENARYEVIKIFRFWDHHSGSSNQVSWQNNFNRCLRMLNYARKHLELPEITESDLKLKPIEGKKPNESPQIPDNNEPGKIKGSKFDDYNNLYSGKNHEVHREFEKLHQEIIGQFYSKNGREWNQAGYDNLAKFPSFAEAYEKLKEASSKARQFIPHDADASLENRIKADNEKDINKMREAIESMKKLLAESKNSNNSISKGQDSKVGESESKKRKFEIESLEENNKKSKTIANELNRLISEAENKNDYGELEAIIKKIDKYQGEEEYTSHREKIDQLKVKLGSLDKDKFRQLTIKKIEGLMKDSKLEKSDLDQEDKEELESLKNENDISKINQLENKIGEKIGKKGAVNSLSKLLEEAKNLVKNTAKATTEELLKQVNKIKKDLYSFQFSTNSWKTNAYQNQEKEVKSVLNQLESFSTQTVQKPKSVFSRPEIMVPVALVAVLGIVGVSVAIAKKRKKAKVEF